MMKTLTLLSIVPVTMLIASCALFGIRYTIEFSPLERADRLVVFTRSGDMVKTITDPSQVSAAAHFIQAYRSGWQDPLRGPVVPDFVLHFYAGSRGLGGYGIGVGYLMSDPPTAGFWSRPAPPEEVNRLASMLGLKLGGNQTQRQQSGVSEETMESRCSTRNLRWMALVALAVLHACRQPPPASTPPPTPVLNAVLLPGQRLTFAHPDGSGGYEAMPAASVILRFTSAWPLDGERVEVTVSPFTGPGGSSTLTWVRRDDVTRKQQLASAGYIETVVDGYGYSVILTPPSALRTATGINVALRTSQGGTAANPASYSPYISLLLKPKAARTLPSAVFFDCTEQGGGGVGSWYNTCKNSSSIVARNVVLEGWVRSPGPNCFGNDNDPICVEDWHYDFAPDPDFIEQMYGPAGAFASLGDRTLESAPTLLHGNLPGAAADAMPIADQSTTGQSRGITINSFVQPDNRPGTDPLDSVVVIKAELNAWHVSNQGSPLCGRFLGFCRNWIGRGPPPRADWIGLPQAAYGGNVDATAAGNAFWPYDPRLLRSGQPLGDGEYVRVSGTLWQDTDHGGVTRWTRLEPAFGGWLEIHPVDWIVRSTPPAVPKTVRMVETINWLSTVDFAETRNLAPSDPMPSGAVLRCRELVDGRFTDPASVLQHSAVVGTADVVVQTTVSRFMPVPLPARPGRFKAAYILWWEQGGQPRAACTQG